MNRIGSDQLFLGALRGRTPERNSVVVMVVRESDEQLLVSDKPSRLAVTLSFRSFG
jgi:hypothetical protein